MFPIDDPAAGSFCGARDAGSMEENGYKKMKVQYGTFLFENFKGNTIIS
ncbi:MAG: hypothetical protein KH366_24275 [Clostridiaceae bacterium]|nr:hypothetical protein [Clostridiaceae bacterium]